MKLAEIDIGQLILEFETEQQQWSDIRTVEKRPLSDVELVTICMLQAFTRILKRINAPRF
jgi:hypothetical protein